MLCAGAVIGVSLAACSNADREDRPATRNAQTTRPTVYVVNYPLQFFAERIGAGMVDVVFPAPADVDPALWMPDAETVAAYQSADLILLNGATYAKWIGRVSLPQAKLVNTSASFRDRFLTMHGVVTHAHGPGGEHSHTGTGFTTWVDLAQAARQAQAIKDAFLAHGIGRAADVVANYETLARELVALDSTVASVTAGHADVPIMASHPVYDYFARRYHLNIKSVLWEPGAYPGDGAWLKLGEVLQEHQARWMIWEGPPLAESVERLERMGMRSVVFDPCGNRPDQGDFMTVMRENADRLRQVWQATD